MDKMVIRLENEKTILDLKKNKLKKDEVSIPKRTFVFARLI